MQKEIYPNPSSDYVLIDQEEINILSKYILDYRTIETGGQLFGHWTIDWKPIVLFVLGPGPQAQHCPTFFLQDINYHSACANFLKQTYKLEHIGEWHSHHQLGLAYPSAHDAQNISMHMARLGYQKFLLCIGTCTSEYSSINAFIFNQNKAEYTHVPWAIRNIENPSRRLMHNSDLQNIVYPKTQSPNMQHLYEQALQPITSQEQTQHSYWLADQNNRKILKLIIDFLNNESTQECIATLDGHNELHLAISTYEYGLIDIYFPSEFPIEPPIVRNINDVILSQRDWWVYTDNIFESFTNFFNNLKVEQHKKNVDA